MSDKPPIPERIKNIIEAMGLLTPYMSYDVLKEWKSSAHITIGADPACQHIERYLDCVIAFRRGEAPKP